MVCGKCGSNRVNVQAVNEITLEVKRKGILWWIFVSWWWIPIKWFVFTVPALLVAIFRGKRKKLVNRSRSIAVCQNCGAHWPVSPY